MTTPCTYTQQHSIRAPQVLGIPLETPALAPHPAGMAALLWLAWGEGWFWLGFMVNQA